MKNYMLCPYMHTSVSVSAQDVITAFRNVQRVRLPVSLFFPKVSSKTVVMFWLKTHLPNLTPPCWLVVEASALGAEDPGFESHLRQDFSRSNHTSNLKIGTPVATLPGAWHYRVSAGTGQPVVSIL